MSSRSVRRLSLLVLSLVLFASYAQAAFRRQYYDTSWNYNTNYGYYYTNYYFTTTVTQTTYEYNYCIYYPSQPTYIYYYNPGTNVYWGRYEIGSKGEHRYSMLEPKDRKKDLKEIPESAFPKPGAMPTIPGSKDDEKMAPPPENVPKDAGKDKDKEAK